MHCLCDMEYATFACNGQMDDRIMQRVMKVFFIECHI
jgi:hypothetical protein